MSIFHDDRLPIIISGRHGNLRLWRSLFIPHDSLQGFPFTGLGIINTSKMRAFFQLYKSFKNILHVMTVKGI